MPSKTKRKAFWQGSPEAVGEDSRLSHVCVEIAAWPNDSGHQGWAKWQTLFTENTASLEIRDGNFSITSWKHRPTGSDPIQMCHVTDQMREEDSKYLEKLLRATIADETCYVLG